MKANTFAPEGRIPELSDLPWQHEARPWRGAKQKSDAGILTFVYRLPRVNVSGEAESENGLPA